MGGLCTHFSVVSIIIITFIRFHDKGLSETSTSTICVTYNGRWLYHGKTNALQYYMRRWQLRANTQTIARNIKDRSGQQAQARQPPCLKTKPNATQWVIVRDNHFHIQICGTHAHLYMNNHKWSARAIIVCWGAH